MSTEAMDKVGSAVAQQKAMERGPTFLPHGCRLFRIAAGWESQMVKRDQAVVSCETLLDLEKAVQSPDVKVVFIPMNAIIAEQDIEKICQRNGVTKTLFKEVKE